MKKIALLLTLLGIFSCKSTKNSTTAVKDNFAVENLAGMNAEEIKKSHPEANIKEDIGMFEEGTEERPYSILYPGTADELHITWEDNARTKIHDIRFTENGKWKSSHGITIGTTYEELNRLNGKPVSFYGFGWDYSGAVMWNDGKFENSNLRVFLAPEKSPGNKFYGDHIIKASAEEIASLDLRVRTIIYKM